VRAASRRRFRALPGAVGEAATPTPSGPRGIGYLKLAACERTVAVLLSGGEQAVIRRRPEGAWTHAVWDKAFGK
jgi:NitT/TauT family transport system substrate-binding protein